MPPEIQNLFPEMEKDLAATLEGLRQSLGKPSIAEQAAPRPIPQPEPLPRRAQVIQLPLWPEPARGTPNSFLRSALFAAIQGKTRRALKGELLGAQKGYSVKFTGWQLDQSDLDVWEQAIHLARMHPLGTECTFRANAFLKAIGRSNGKKDYTWLNDSFTRLVACAVEIRNGKKVFTGGLLDWVMRDEETGIYRLGLNEKTILLYGAADWTALEWSQREALKGKPLALWLHGFYATHAQAYPMKVETLQELSGSGNKEKRLFKRRLKEALNLLVAIGCIISWKINDDDLVFVEKKGTQAQVKHLQRTKRKQKM